VLFSALLATFNSLEGTRHISDRIQFDRVENSFRYLQQWDTASLLKARDLFREIAKEKDAFSQDAIKARFKTDSELERSVIYFFNFVEEILLSIESKRVDEDVLKDAFQEVFRINHEIFFRTFESYRKSSTARNSKKLSDRWQ